MSEPTTSSLHVYTSCPVCQSKDISSALNAKDFTVSYESFDIWECHQCQLRFTQSIPQESEIGKYYQSEEYISHSNTSKGLINQLYQWVRDFTLVQKRNLIHKLTGKKTGSLLDIGCGTGEFLGKMKDAGWKVMGLEPDEGAREQGRTNHGITVEPSEKLFDLTANQYDAISMWHVLEHVHRLDEYLKKINQLLVADGVLIIAVPNYQSADAEWYDSEWAAYDVPRHLYHFSHSSMVQLMDRHGFKLDTIKRMPFDAFYVSLLSEKYRHGQPRLVPGFFNGFRSYLQSLGRKDRSSSIMYIIRKK